eukprot:TRINITY_DN17238_c0_g1_i1.p2 TRINITY_DN17238_c0_g1~~TRINITY_DN17238_c0_g1_i1.p2  ORF type:complete len:501 (+),score=121.92 TRINITY_DN17238_c0_g1_i1:93-1505(+)
MAARPDALSPRQLQQQRLSDTLRTTATARGHSPQPSSIPGDVSSPSRRRAGEAALPPGTTRVRGRSPSPPPEAPVHPGDPVGDCLTLVKGLRSACAAVFRECQRYHSCGSPLMWQPSHLMQQPPRWAGWCAARRARRQVALPRDVRKGSVAGNFLSAAGRSQPFRLSPAPPAGEAGRSQKRGTFAGLHRGPQMETFRLVRGDSSTEGGSAASSPGLRLRHRHRSMRRGSTTTRGRSPSVHISAWLEKRRRRLDAPTGWAMMSSSYGYSSYTPTEKVKRTKWTRAEPPPPPPVPPTPPPGPVTFLTRRPSPSCGFVQAQTGDAELWTSAGKLRRLQEAEECCERLIADQAAAQLALREAELSELEQDAAAAGTAVPVAALRELEAKRDEPLSPEFVTSQRRAVYEAFMWPPDTDLVVTAADLKPPRQCNWALLRSFRAKAELSPTPQYDAWADVPGALHLSAFPHKRIGLY